MRVLLVKMSSLGDVVHTLPALTEAAAACPDLSVDWLVEETFAEIPSWHPAVDQVIPVALRRWRKQGWRGLFNGEFAAVKQQLREREYDLVIDAQGLLKSAFMSWQVKTRRVGLSRSSAKEPLAALAYHEKVDVAWGQHAVERVRQLMAAALDYEISGDGLDAGLNRRQPQQTETDRVMLLHGTTREDKYWPETHWISLAKRLVESGRRVSLPWGNEEEQQRAQRIADASGAEVLPKMNLQGVSAALQSSAAVVSVDTGLGHLAAALAVPAVALYGPTDPHLVGTWGLHQRHLSAFDEGSESGATWRSAPMAEISPARVFQVLQQQMMIEGNT